MNWQIWTILLETVIWIASVVVIRKALLWLNLMIYQWDVERIHGGYMEAGGYQYSIHRFNQLMDQDPDPASVEGHEFAGVASAIEEYETRKEPSHEN